VGLEMSTDGTNAFRQLRRDTLLTCAEDRAPQGCDLSAAASADWRGGNAVPLRASLLVSDESWGRRGKAPEDTSAKERQLGM
jgi:hypothetical protein